MNRAGYAASKGGLLQLTKWLSTYLAPDVRVNMISPNESIEIKQKVLKQDMLQILH